MRLTILDNMQYDKLHQVNKLIAWRLQDWNIGVPNHNSGCLFFYASRPIPINKIIAHEPTRTTAKLTKWSGSLVNANSKISNKQLYETNTKTYQQHFFLRGATIAALYIQKRWSHNPLYIGAITTILKLEV